MTRLILRATLALLLLGGVGAAGPSVARMPLPAPQRVPEGFSVNPKAIQDVLPTLDLLITVQLLPGLLEREEITLDAVASQDLRALLRPLLTRKALPPADARRLETSLHAILSPSQELALKQARAALEARTQAFMTRARFATPDGPLNLTLTRYGLMVPGGQATVKAVLGANVSPYAQAGVNAELLARLLDLLEP
ncbi:hypothetical protein [Deinococcus sp. AJ005]|uniref:hypothetical protein n=1 Tax=Deinococcus sp. AJ005 TaxID=2652443 RepID=UPI00125CC449|nr:hypothetical protein [Deinococcus sp. AJ005]QFP77581.1 hypothetical protein DAAJ005_14800 [Deinococcus sp. AJ005]